MRNPTPWLVLSCSLFALELAPAQASTPVPTLVKNINVTNVTAGSGPRGYARLGSAIYFNANVPPFGAELWRLDDGASTPTLVADIEPGGVGSNPFRVNVAGSWIYFVAGFGLGSNRVLWQSDGTSAGTMPTPNVPSLIFGLFPFGDRLVIEAEDAAHGRELWVSDGTAGGTTVLDFAPGPTGSGARVLGVFNGLMLFSRDDGSGLQLVATDFTPGNTTTLIQVDNAPESMFDNGSEAWFGVRATSEAQIWTTDGTVAGTSMVATTPLGSVGPFGLTIVGNHLFFQFAVFPPLVTLARGTIYSLDLTTNATQSLLTGANLTGIAPVGNGVCFVANLFGPNNNELWFSDGTPAGTQVLVDINPGFPSSSPREFVAIQNELVFSAQGDVHGRELWRTDGTVAGTQLIADIAPGTANTNPEQLWVDDVAGRVLSTLDSPVVGEEPFAYTPDPSGVGVGSLTLLADVNPVMVSPRGSRPFQAIELYGTTLFVADDGVHGRELWATDGTDAGTSLVRDFAPGLADTNFSTFHVVGEVVMFAIDDAVWRTDGTPAGTNLVIDTQSGDRITSLAAIGRTLYFEADDGVHGPELWRSDGTPSATQLVVDAVPGTGGSFPRRLTAVGDTLFFTARTPATGEEVWSSRGTAATTGIVMDLVPGSASSDPIDLVAFDNALFFRADTPATGLEIWRTDGSVTVPIEFFPGPPGVRPFQLTPVRDQLFFVPFFVNLEDELYVTDGTPGSIRLVREVNPGPTESELRSLTPFGDRVLFEARGPSGLNELWVSDGTFSGTMPLAGLGGTSSAPATEIVVSGDRYAWFVVSNESTTSIPELWRTDGTPAGTVFVAADARPLALAQGGSQLFLGIEDAMIGDELWAVDPGASHLPVGSGCPDGLREARLVTTDPIIGQPMFVDVLDRPPASGVVVVGTQSAPLPLPLVDGCDWYLGTVFNQIATGVPGVISVPNNSALFGRRFAMQAFFGIVTTNPLGIESTNGVHFRIGD